MHVKKIARANEGSRAMHKDQAALQGLQSKGCLANII
jgi:hypothetical protein